MGAWGGRGTGAMGRRDPCPAVPSPSRRWVGLGGRPWLCRPPNRWHCLLRCGDRSALYATGGAWPPQEVGPVSLGRPGEITPARGGYGVLQVVYHEQLTR